MVKFLLAEAKTVQEKYTDKPAAQKNQKTKTQQQQKPKNKTTLEESTN